MLEVADFAINQNQNYFKKNEKVCQNTCSCI